MTVDWIPGDLDGSDLVDLADFVDYKQSFGSNHPPADIDNSGLVDLGDFVILKNHFGESR